MGSTNDDKLFEKDKSFWDNYLRGRPKPPSSLFRRIFDYHEAYRNPKALIDLS